MEYRRLGSSGLVVSRIGLGCMSYATPSDGKVGGSHAWSLDEEASRPFIRQALDAGITFFDTANAYGRGSSEEILGRALRDFARREDVVVATKVYFETRPGPYGHGLSRKAIFNEIDASLRRLGMDYVDLYQIHRFDPETPLEETLEALNDLVRTGRVRYLGASSMFAWQLMKSFAIADRRGWSSFVSMQNHYNALYREEEREMTGLCLDRGVGMIPWSPLARGKLARGPEDAITERSTTDRYGKTLYDADSESDRGVIGAVGRVAEERGLSRAQVALAWLLAQPGVTAPIVGATKPQHLTDAVAATAIGLTPEELASIAAPYRPHAVSGIS